MKNKIEFSFPGIREYGQNFCIGQRTSFEDCENLKSRAAKIGDAPELWKLKIMTKLFCGVAIVLVSLLSPAYSQVSEGTLVIRPGEIDDVLVNPGIGIQKLFK